MKYLSATDCDERNKFRRVSSLCLLRRSLSTSWDVRCPGRKVTRREGTVPAADRLMHLLRSSRSLLIANAAALCCLSLARADEGISTDRPDFVESSQVVGKGRFQLESGLSRERSVDSSGTKLRGFSTPMLLRFGIDDAVELRIETDGYQRTRSEDAATSAVTRERGFADASLGVKWHMQDGDEEVGRPAIAWLLHVDVDSGSAAFRGRGVRPSLRVVGEWELADEMSVGVMGGVAVDRPLDGGRFAAGILAVTVGKSWTDRFRTFVELAGRQIASASHGGSVVSFDVGTAYLLSPSMQVDAVISRGITRQSPDLQFGAGLSIKF